MLKHPGILWREQRAGLLRQELERDVVDRDQRVEEVHLLGPLQAGQFAANNCDTKYKRLNAIIERNFILLQIINKQQI